MSDQNYLASLRGGSTISPAGHRKQFLPLDLDAQEEKFPESLCACDSTSGYLLVSRADLHHWFVLFSHYSGSRFTNCNVHRFGANDFSMLGSLADGVFQRRGSGTRRMLIICIVGCHVVTVH